MLKPIPARILRSTATVTACTGCDRYQKPTTAEYTVNRVHLQPTSEVIKSTDNTDRQLRSVLFADGRISTPLDWESLFSSSHDNMGDLKVTVRNVTYTVVSVDALRDDQDRFHHWEIGLA